MFLVTAGLFVAMTSLVPSGKHLWPAQLVRRHVNESFVWLLVHSMAIPTIEDAK
jgi:hypothetical protein